MANREARGGSFDVARTFLTRPPPPPPLSLSFPRARIGGRIVRATSSDDEPRRVSPPRSSSSSTRARIGSPLCLVVSRCVARRRTSSSRCVVVWRTPPSFYGRRRAVCGSFGRVDRLGGNGRYVAFNARLHHALCEAFLDPGEVRIGSIVILATACRAYGFRAASQHRTREVTAPRLRSPPRAGRALGRGRLGARPQIAAESPPTQGARQRRVQRPRRRRRRRRRVVRARRNGVARFRRLRPIHVRSSRRPGVARAEGVGGSRKSRGKDRPSDRGGCDARAPRGDRASCYHRERVRRAERARLFFAAPPVTTLVCVLRCAARARPPLAGVGVSLVGVGGAPSSSQVGAGGRVDGRADRRGGVRGTALEDLPRARDRRRARGRRALPLAQRRAARVDRVPRGRRPVEVW